MTKPFITYTTQIEKLKNEKNLIITNTDFALTSLKNISYYGLIDGYKHPFIDIHTRKYVNNTCFENIVALYELDEEALKSDDMDEYCNKALKQMSRKRPNYVEYHLDNIVEDSQEGNVSEDDKKSWEDKHNFYNSFSSVDPTQYDHEKDYLNDLRKQWKQYYDPSDMYDVDPKDYDNEEDYMEAIKQYIKSKYK